MNARTLDRPAVAVPSPRRIAAAYLEEIRCEALRLLRNPGLALPTLAMPVALYALIALVVTGEATAKEPVTALFLFCAFSVMAVSMPALFGIGHVRWHRQGLSAGAFQHTADLVHRCPAPRRHRHTRAQLPQPHGQRAPDPRRPARDQHDLSREWLHAFFL